SVADFPGGRAGSGRAPGLRRGPAAGFRAVFFFFFQFVADRPGRKPMKIFVAGLSYKTAPVELREKLAVHPSRLRCTGCRIKLVGGLSEVVLLSTCNRVEIYGVAETVNGNIYKIFQHLSGSQITDFSSHLFIKE